MGLFLLNGAYCYFLHWFGIINSFRNSRRFGINELKFTKIPSLMEHVYDMRQVINACSSFICMIHLWPAKQKKQVFFKRKN
jgi:hypothetical protein